MAHRESCVCVVCKQKRLKKPERAAPLPKPRAKPVAPKVKPEVKPERARTAEEIKGSFEPIVKTLKKLRTLQKLSGDMPREKASPRMS